MEKQIYAYCSHIEAFHKNKLLSAEYCSQFPWLNWLSFFIKFAKESGHNVLTGDICLKKVFDKEIKASDVIVIADLDSKISKLLVSEGSKPGIVLCYESPLFAEKFYQNAVNFCADYPAGILFHGIIEKYFSGKNNFHPIRYPSFSNDEITAEIIPWEERNDLVMVVSNKYYRNPFHLKTLLTPKALEAWFRGKFKISSNPIKRDAIKNQLHDKRLEAIENLGGMSLLDLYGRNWNDLGRLPLKWRNRLKGVVKKLSPVPCVDKKRTMSSYKFAICFENTIYPGYMSEKIIDCLVAGVIPIYLGDPDILRIIPREIFIDMRDYNSWEDLRFMIKSIGKDEGENMIKSAREFLYSETGQEFTYLYHAKKVFHLLSV